VAGFGRLDGLADCSGYYVPGDWRGDPEEWARLVADTMSVNIVGPMNLVRAVLPDMISRRSGRIALVGSMAGRSGGATTAAEPAYVASKGGLHALVRYLAKQVAHDGIVVNSVAPGVIDTKLAAAARQPFETTQFPLGRLGTAAEVGWPVAFLLTPAVSYMTGTIVDVNGGMTFS
jgi:NAD(P)-dependent dehydrogenase (short-subunit alcohol dehydrogenase family)